MKKGQRPHPASFRLFPRSSLPSVYSRSRTISLIRNRNHFKNKQKKSILMLRGLARTRMLSLVLPWQLQMPFFSDAGDLVNKLGELRCYKFAIAVMSSCTNLWFIGRVDVHWHSSQKKKSFSSNSDSIILIYAVGMLEMIRGGIKKKEKKSSWHMIAPLATSPIMSTSSCPLQIIK